MLDPLAIPAQLIDALADRVADRVLVRLPQPQKSTGKDLPVTSAPKLLLSADEAGELCGTSGSTIKRMADAGEIHRVKLLGCTKFSRVEIEAWIQRQVTGGPSPERMRISG